MEQVIRYDDKIADAYAAMLGDTVEDPGTSALLELLGEVSGMRVLDLPCGEGRVARELARRGARVVGVDLSAAMLDRARAFESDDPAGITYVLANGTKPDALQGERFDRVVCNFGLSDIDDFDGILATFTRVLQPGGVFVFSIMHPCFPGWGDVLPGDSPPDGGYFNECWWAATAGPAIDPRHTVGTNHRMVSTYFNTFVRVGLVLEAVSEPEPGAEWQLPEAEPVPMFLVARYRKLE
ncbi:MAG: methyltransferase domain-containing protein [Acidimicrobiia bacterium]